MLVLVTIFFFLPIFVASTISFHDPVGYLDNLDSINLHTLERLYPISGNVSVVVLPQSVTNVKGGEVSAVKQYASEFFANSTDRGLVIGIFTSSSQISIFDPSSDSEDENSIILKRIESRGEESLQFSTLDGLKQLVKDLHCFSNFKAIDNPSIALNSSRFVWEPIVNFLAFISTVSFLLVQHSVTAIASLPRVGDPRSSGLGSRSRVVAWLLERWPWSEQPLSLLLFCVTALFVSCLAALLFCVLLALYQVFASYHCGGARAKSSSSNEGGMGVVKKAGGAKCQVVLSSSVSRFLDSRGGVTVNNSTTTTSSRSAREEQSQSQVSSGRTPSSRGGAGRK